MLDKEDRTIGISTDSPALVVGMAIRGACFKFDLIESSGYMRWLLEWEDGESELQADNESVFFIESSY